MLEYLGQVLRSVADVLTGLAPVMLPVAVVATALFFLSNQACNPGTPWWRNRGLVTDMWYCVFTPFASPIMRLVGMYVIAVMLLPFMTADQLSDYITNGRGPLSPLGFWGQVAFYLIVSDFLLYWIHRCFHGRRLWPFHAIHHSAEHVDWTTAYRFHPVNLTLGAFFVDMVLYFAGVSLKVLVFMAPFQTVTALFVHANLNWTLGPLKYVIATPVFHRWHHGPPHLGGEKNFAPLFPFWDYLFGTFYMPEGQLPQEYGVEDPHMPQGFFQQLIYPFRGLFLRAEADQVSASPSALESAQPQRGS